MTLLTDARAYVSQRFGPLYEAWSLLDDTQATKTLVSAADLLNLLPWQGTFTGTLPLATAASLVWPRSGVVVDGVEVSSLTIPTDVQNAQYELAVQIRAKPAIGTTIDSGSNIKSVGGGGAPTVEFFSPTSVVLGTATELPVAVERRIAKYLTTPSETDAGGFGSAGSACSSMNSDRIFDLVGPQ